MKCSMLRAPFGYLLLPLLMVLTLGVTSCRPKNDLCINWPSLGTAEDPFHINPDLLPEPVGSPIQTYTNPTTSPLMPWQFYNEIPSPDLETGEPKRGVIVHHFPFANVGGHYQASGTFVFYLPRDGLFYLYGDDYMGHHDGMVGPFAGDPCRLLAELEDTPGPFELGLRP